MLLGMTMERLGMKNGEIGEKSERKIVSNSELTEELPNSLTISESVKQIRIPIH